ncbi:unnamed protein product [Protopolystoma xenopodis]|uniref:EF-hand domain-containing protein n=1 Tax=Protopolystoma xenopodis TaxID=117903 RepID=A0A3S5BSX0_9PLAT|nr:unnamed protein product [Protopolystoma xenopodis]
MSLTVTPDHGRATRKMRRLLVTPSNNIGSVYKRVNIMSFTSNGSIDFKEFVLMMSDCYANNVANLVETGTNEGGDMSRHWPEPAQRGQDSNEAIYRRAFSVSQKASLRLARAACDLVFAT